MGKIYNVQVSGQPTKLSVTSCGFMLTFFPKLKKKIKTNFIEPPE